MRRLALVCLAGCGRISFDPRTDARTGDARAADGSIAARSIAWWKLDDGTGITAVDSIGSADGVLTAGSSAVVPMWVATTAPRPPGFAVQFKGDGDRIIIGQAPALTDLPQLTVAGWIDAANVTDSGTVKDLFDKGSSGVAGWSLTIARNGNGTLGFIAFFGSTTVEVTSDLDVLQVNRWTHVAATWDGSPSSAGMHLYIDGAAITTNSVREAMLPRPSDSSLDAAINSVANTGLAGQIDDVTIFDRVLTPAELAQLYGS